MFASLALALLLGTTPLASDSYVRVFAATSTRGAIADIAATFRQSSSAAAEILINDQASSTLARQILAGAACDIFVSADFANMKRVIDAGEVAAADITSVAAGRLVIIVADGVEVPATAEELLSNIARRIALCDAAVPLGSYAREYLNRRGIARSAEAKAVIAENARAAVDLVRHGAADAAIVYESDALVAERCRIAFTPPPEHQPEIRIYAAMTRAGKSRGEPAVATFFELLRGDAGKAAFERAKFRPVPAAASQPATSTQPASAGHP